MLTKPLVEMNQPIRQLPERCPNERYQLNGY